MVNYYIKKLKYTTFVKAYVIVSTAKQELGNIDDVLLLLLKSWYLSRITFQRNKAKHKYKMLLPTDLFPTTVSFQ